MVRPGGGSTGSGTGAGWERFARNPYRIATWDGAAAAAQAGSGAEPPDWRRDPAFAIDAGARPDEGGATEVGGTPGEPDPDAGGGAGAAETDVAYDPPELPRDLVDPFELARRTVNQSRAVARDRGLYPISAKTQARDVRDRSSSAPGYSGARPDPRDPQGAELVVRRVLASLGWQEGMSSGRVLEEWDEIVGEQVAAHCRPVTLDAGVLVVSASSSAWATQLRMISPQLVTRIHEHVGMSVVSELKVTGPAARSWKRGRRTVTWRGPRDTYG